MFTTFLCSAKDRYVKLGVRKQRIGMMRSVNDKSDDNDAEDTDSDDDDKRSG